MMVISPTYCQKIFDYLKRVANYLKFVDGNVLELNLSSEFLNSESRNTIEQLVWTYCDEEISELRVSVENEPINNLNGFISYSLFISVSSLSKLKNLKEIKINNINILKQIYNRYPDREFAKSIKVILDQYDLDKERCPNCGAPPNF